MLRSHWTGSLSIGVNISGSGICCKYSAGGPEAIREGQLVPGLGGLTLADLPDRGIPPSVLPITPSASRTDARLGQV